MGLIPCFLTCLAAPSGNSGRREAYSAAEMFRCHVLLNNPVGHMSPRHPLHPQLDSLGQGNPHYPWSPARLQAGGAAWSSISLSRSRRRDRRPGFMRATCRIVNNGHEG